MTHMDKGTGLILEYENIMLGNRKTYSAEFLKEGVTNRELAAVLRYVFVDILGWSAADCQNRITKPLIEKLGLSRIVSRIKFPVELDRNKDMFYLAMLIYPEVISYNKQDYVLRVYKAILSGELFKFPRGFFNDREGHRSLLTCLRYAISEYLPYTSTQAIFLFFANTARSDEFLSKVRLAGHVKKYCPYAIELVYELYGGADEAEFWYHYGRFAVEWNKIPGQVRKVDIKI